MACRQLLSNLDFWSPLIVNYYSRTMRYDILLWQTLFILFGTRYYPLLMHVNIVNVFLFILYADICLIYCTCNFILILIRMLRGFWDEIYVLYDEIYVWFWDEIDVYCIYIQMYTTKKEIMKLFQHAWCDDMGSRLEIYLMITLKIFLWFNVTIRVTRITREKKLCVFSRHYFKFYLRINWKHLLFIRTRRLYNARH